MEEKWIKRVARQTQSHLKAKQVREQENLEIEGMTKQTQSEVKTMKRG